MSKKVRVIVALIVVLVVGAIVAVNVTRDRRSRIAVQTQKVERRDIVSIVTASGEIKPKRYVNVSSDIPGRIVKLFVREGDRVREGQPLCRIDATLGGLREHLKSAELSLQEAAYGLRDYLSGLEANPARLEEVETRLEAIARLKRKYGHSMAEILAYRLKCILTEKAKSVTSCSTIGLKHTPNR